ncbi:P-loop containing nucleoside triphosphate hydrolase protein [Stachybotrys elegans]|uniref:P-loop containing nucleoside triphosphate hydrolase protein n=1 Tax=Stachybotrys elegans TaxID=80388 RepID=A0A8K0SMP9_9HYPO|nr:P-loop containing nucleoside triphosphate hydrolase protein [Stachybotrys elegans]
MGFASPTEKLLYGIGALAAMGSGAVLPLMTLIFGNFVSVFTDFALSRIGTTSFQHKISYYTLFFIYLFIAKAACTYIYMLLFSIVAANVNSALRKRYVHVVLHQDIAYHETVLTSGAVSLALSTHSNAVRSGLAEKFGLSLKSVSTVVAAFAVALHSQWKLALVTATIIPAAVLAVGATSVFDEKQEQTLNEIKADAATLADDMMSSVRTVRALGAEERLGIKYKAMLQQAVTVGLRRAPIQGVQAGVYMFLLYGGYALAFWYGIRLYINAEAARSGTVITTLFAIMIGVNAFSELAGYLGPFLRIRSAGAELFKVIDLGQEAIKTATKLVDAPPDTFRGNITLDGVSFRYPARDKVTVLNDLTLTIPAGKTTALVGPSGSGKSTVVGLLLKWYDIASGHIRIGNSPLSEISSKPLRASIGFVQQEPYLFTGTVYENIEYGLAGSLLEQEPPEEKRRLIIEACKVSNAHDFITRLPMGYDTPVGNRGTMLSGGQKQRLAIARAIVKNPSILILDEATSALDVSSESLVQQALDSARRDRTTIIIAHRLTTIKNADQIVVIKSGSVAETGSHASLLSKNDGIYKSLWDSQALSQSPENQSEDEKTADADADALQPSKELALARNALPLDSTNDVCDAPKVPTWKLLKAAMMSQKKYWWIFLIICACGTIGGALFPVQAFLYAKVVTTFQLAGRALVSGGNFWSLMWFVLAISVGIGYFGIGWAGSALGELISQAYRHTYFQSMMSQPMAFFDLAENSPGHLLSRLSSDPDAVNALIGSNLAVLVTVGVGLLSCVILALAIGWKLGLVVLFGGFPFIFGAGIVHEKMQNSFEEKSGAMLTESVGYAAECIQAIRTVSALNTEPVIERRFVYLLESYSRNARRYALRSMVWFALSDSIDLLCMALAFWYGGRLLSYHEYSTTQFFMVFISVVFGAQTTGQFFAHSSDISLGIASTRAIHELQATSSEASKSTEIVDEVSAPDHQIPYVEFRDTAFAYPSRPSQLVLKHLNLKVYKGQSIALVGSSGCGKSTVIQLLERFYEPTAGDILLSGTPMSNYSPKAVRNLFALVSQEPVLYHGTVEDNINLGRHERLSPDELDWVIRQAQLTDLVSSLPDGVRTSVGSRGTQLSGGQKQRIAIARAIAVDAPILLLDEATSALDGESEGLIQRAIKDGARGKTVISIAHRLSTIQHSDCIYVVDGGKVVESGTHSELLAARGQYWAMVMSQIGTQP